MVQTGENLILNLAIFNHWRKFYGGEKAGKVPLEPSLFARWCNGRNDFPQTIADLGCGTGRDTSYFHNQWHNVQAVDGCPEALAYTGYAAALPITDGRVPNRIAFCCAKLEDLPDLALYVNGAYIRFVLHAITPDTQERLLSSIREAKVACLFIESRATENESEVETTEPHYRRPIYLPALLKQLRRIGYRDTYSAESYDFAPQGTERPRILRVVAELT